MSCKIHDPSIKENKMKLKILMFVTLVLSIMLCIVGCDNHTYEKDGVIYKREGDFYVVEGISDTNNTSDVIYVLDEIEGKQVFALGHKSPVVGRTGYIYRSHTQRIYFPWSITVVADNLQRSCEQGCEGTLQYVISASTTLIDTTSYGKSKNVVPQIVYRKISIEENVNEQLIYQENIDSFLPANIAFFFNYEKNPNSGYFFIDIAEESGKLTKPPYDPKRDGYKFAGWYKEAECTNQWNFETDTVTIGFDEEGNRIYEEIKLYAKWVKHWSIPAKPNVFR